MEVQIISKVCKTVFKDKIIDPDRAIVLYYMLKDGIVWEEGIRSKKGFTRKAKAIEPTDFPEIDRLVVEVLSKITTTKYGITGIYLNYYEDGNMWTPNHTHPGTHQLVISLGATRTLNVAKKSYQIGNGDAIIFGSSIHGIPKEPTIKEGRISIATFMVPIQ